MDAFAKVLAYAAPAMVAAASLGLIVSSALKAAGRNPEKISGIQTMMIVGAAFVDALAIFGLVAFFMM